MSEHTSEVGPICQTEQGQVALKKLLQLSEVNQGILSIKILKNQNNNILHLPSGKILISESFINSLKKSAELFAIIEKIKAENDNQNPLKMVIAEQSFLHLIKFGISDSVDFQESNNKCAVVTRYLLSSLINKNALPVFIVWS